MEGNRKNNPVNVPEGYFDDLRMRLEAIPHEDRTRNSVWGRLVPYASLAACFAVLALAGNAVLRHTVKDDMADESEYYFYAELSRNSQNELMYGSEETVEALSDEDIINYLIESSTNEVAIAYFDKQ